MTRPATPQPAADALAEDSLLAFPLVELYFDSGTVYLAGAPHDVVWGGNTYTAAQGVGSIDAITETGSGAAGIAFTMPLVSDAAVVSVLTTPMQGRRVIIRNAVLIAGVIDATDVVWDGTLDVATMNLANDQPAVRVTSEHAMRRWSVPIGTKLSDADHQRQYPGDLFFEYADQMVDVTLVWPSKVFYQQ